MINENNTAVAIDAMPEHKVSDTLMLWRAEAPIQLEALVYITCYAFDPQVAKDKCEQALLDLGFEGEIVHV